MPKLTLLFALLLLGFHFRGLSQAIEKYHRCGTMLHWQNALKKDPSLATVRVNIEKQTQAALSQKRVNARGAIISVPVVFHVVYKTAVQNISDARILAMLKQVNDDYSANNANISSVPTPFKPLIGNMNVQFCLAQKDPSGNATTGIRRVLSDSSSFSMDSDGIKKPAVGGTAGWPSDKYLNIWIGDLKEDIIGYSQFPGEPPATDGVVLNYKTVGSISTPGTAAPYNLGRTATHEIGHWLNLMHTWGDDDGACTGTDLINDTPNQGDANYGCPAFPRISCDNGPNGDLFMNFMDYSDDACMSMFTVGQANRMAAQFAPGGSRVSFLTADGCNPPNGFSFNSPSALRISCSTASSFNFNFTLSRIGNFSAPITLSYVSGLPAGVGLTFSKNPVAIGETVTATVSNSSLLLPKDYIIKISGTSGSITNEMNVAVGVDFGQGPQVTTQPINQSNCNGGSVSFTVAASGANTIQWMYSEDNGLSYSLIPGATSATLNITAITSQQNGWLYVADLRGGNCGRTLSNAAKLTVNAGPAVTVSANNTATTPGNPVTLTAQVSPPGNYIIDWFNNGDVLLEYRNQTSITVNFDDIGNYRVRAVSASGCIGFSDQVIVEEGESSELFVLPNPNSGNFSVMYYNANGSEVQRSIIISDAAGKTIYAKRYTISGVYEKMNVQLKASSGIYFIRLFDASGKRIAARKIMIGN